MNDINKTIKHFESLQKRYTTQHNGQMCERVADALEALYRFKSQEDYFEKMFGSYPKHSCNSGLCYGDGKPCYGEDLDYLYHEVENGSK